MLFSADPKMWQKQVSRKGKYHLVQDRWVIGRTRFALGMCGKQYRSGVGYSWPERSPRWCMKCKSILDAAKAKHEEVQMNEEQFLDRVKLKAARGII